jgi:hypothetical protein
LFVQLLLMARKMGALKMGMALNRSKIHANASRHSAPSYEHAGKIETQLKAEVIELLAKAEARNPTEAVACRWRAARHWPPRLVGALGHTLWCANSPTDCGHKTQRTLVTLLGFMRRRPPGFPGLTLWKRAQRT